VFADSSFRGSVQDGLQVDDTSGRTRIRDPSVARTWIRCSPTVWGTRSEDSRGRPRRFITRPGDQDAAVSPVRPGHTISHARFGIATEAFGPFLALCEVAFDDGSRVLLHHYCDFDMGSLLPS
jgi:hypothetical protein